MVRLLIDYGHLYETEQWAKMERLSHEPALSVARRMLRAGEPLPRSLPISGPLKTPPEFPDYNVVDEWVDNANMDTDDQDLNELDEDALLLDESRDLTEEEFDRPLG